MRTDGHTEVHNLGNRENTMKDIEIRVRKNEQGHEAEGVFSPSYPHLANCYYRFGYIRLAMEAARRK